MARWILYVRVLIRMRSAIFDVRRDPTGVTERLLNVYTDIMNFKRRMVGSKVMSVFNKYKREHASLPAPPAFLLGCIEFEVPRTVGAHAYYLKGPNLHGFYVRGERLKVWRMGDVILTGDRFRLPAPRCIEIKSDKRYEFKYFGYNRPQHLSTNTVAPPQCLDEMKKVDPNWYYLLTTEGFHGTRSVQRKEALDILGDCADVTQKQLRELGFVSDRDIELVVNWHPALQSILKANPKPRGCDIKSDSQLDKYRKDKEMVLPDALLNMTGPSSGRTTNQSYEAQIFRALHQSSAASFLQ